MEVLAKFASIGDGRYVLIYAWPAERTLETGESWLTSLTPPWDEGGYYTSDIGQAERLAHELAVDHGAAERWPISQLVYRSEDLPDEHPERWQSVIPCLHCGHIHWIPDADCEWEPDDYPSSPRCQCNDPYPSEAGVS